MRFITVAAFAGAALALPAPAETTAVGSWGNGGNWVSDVDRRMDDCLDHPRVP